MTAFDEQSSSLIKLNNSTVLYLREVNKFLALVCILREYSFSRQGVIDFNFLCFREAIHKVFEVRTTKKCVMNDNMYGDEENDRHPGDIDDEDVDEDEDNLDGDGEEIRRYDDSEDDIKINNNHRVIRLQKHNDRATIYSMVFRSVDSQ